MGGELAQKASSRGSLGTEWKDVVNKDPNFSGQKLGDKYQSTVRFDEKTYRRVKFIQNSLGVSFAEAVRRIVNEGLTQIQEHHRVFLDFLETLYSETEDPGKKEAIDAVEKEVMSNRQELAEGVKYG
ncbi:MAG: hypothetical protein ABEK00_00585 [Candidatus Nanohaloarchaea archaeon]